jgi:XTP/dITP diphosphohydrolase
VKLYLASANPGKVREFREAAQAHGILLEAVPGIEQLPPCVEDGRTFEENARKKALHYSAFTDGLVFADDSGICVDALGGAPGVRSARFAGPEADDAANNRKLLAELHRIEHAGESSCGPPDSESPVEFPASPRRDGGENTAARTYAPTPTNRVAHYVCVIVLAQKGKVLATVEGRVDGLIIDHPRGSSGFGYDPYFLFPPLGKTFAEITSEEKFAVSHRGLAFRKLLDYLCTTFPAPSPAGMMKTASRKAR